MSQGIELLVFPVKDIARAKVLYGNLLGAEPYVDEAYYVGFRIGGLEVGLDPHGHDQGQTGPIAYSSVEDIGARLQVMVDSGARVELDVRDVGGGKLMARLRDADDNVVGLLQQPAG